MAFELASEGEAGFRGGETGMKVGMQRRDKGLPASIYSNVTWGLPVLGSEEAAFELGLQELAGFLQAEMEEKDFPEKGNIPSSQGYCTG